MLRGMQISRMLILAVALLLHAPATFCQDTMQLSGPPNAEQMQAYNMLQQAIAKLQAKQPQAALPLLRQAAKLWPDMPHLHYYTGFACQDTGAYSEAIPEFQQALQSDAKRVSVLTNIATCYQLLGQAGQAADTFEEYLKRQPGDPRAGQIKSSIAALRQHAARQPHSQTSAPDYYAEVTAGGQRRWSRRSLPLKVFIANGTDERGRPVRGFVPDYNFVVMESLNDWMQACGAKLSYVIVPSIAQSDIAFCWSDELSLATQGGHQIEQGLTYTEVAPQPVADGSYEFVRAKITMLVLDRSSGASLNRDQMKRSCLHELGHALGLQGHSNLGQDIMFYSEAPLVQPQLSQRDRATIAKLYASYPVVTGPAR